MTNEIQMNVDRLDNDSVVVNFDLFDTDAGEYTMQGGYVQTEIDNDCFVVQIFNSDGDIISRTEVPFNFKE